MDIEELIERWRQGDETALGSLYGAYHRQMTGICQHIVGNQQVAEELAHDAFLLAFAKMNQLHNPNRFEAWLKSITTNVALRYVQRHHEPTMLSLSTLSEEELPHEPVPSDDKPLPTMTQLIVILTIVKGKENVAEVTCPVLVAMAPAASVTVGHLPI